VAVKSTPQAGRDANQALQTCRAARGQARKTGCTGMHGLRCLCQRHGLGRGLQASACALKQHHIQLLFQLCNVTPQGRLADTGLPCSARQTALLQRSQKRRDQRPIEATFIHT